MTRIGCMNLSFPGMDLETFIRTMHELDLGIIDVHMRAFPSTAPADLRRVKRMCLEYGLFIGYIGTNAVRFTGSAAASGGASSAAEDEIRVNVDSGKEAIDVAAFLGVPLIRVFGSPLPQGVSDPAPLYAPLARCCREIAEYGQAKGVVVGLQNHDNRNLAATAGDVLHILRETGHPNFTHILDTGQWTGSPGANQERTADPNVDIYEQIERTAPHAIHVRCKFYDISSGREKYLDYERIFQILKRVGYKGNVSIVYEGAGDPVQDVRKAAAYLRTLVPTLR